MPLPYHRVHVMSGVLTLVLVGCAAGPEAPKTPAATTARPAAPARPQAFDVKQLDVVPLVKFQARPQYPAAFAQSKTTGEAVVDFIVDSEGNVRNAFALRATHPDFGAAAVAAVEKWKFQPGLKGGRPVSTHLQVPIVFEMDTPPPTPEGVTFALRDATTLEKLDAVDISKLDVTPVAVFQARPQYPAELRRKGIRGEAVTDFIVDVHGNVRNASVLRATHPEIGDAALAAVVQWKFKPGRLGGRAVNTHMQVPIVFAINER